MMNTRLPRSRGRSLSTSGQKTWSRLSQFRSIWQVTVLWRLRLQEHAGDVPAGRALIRNQSRLMSNRRDAHDLFHRNLASRAERTGIVVSVGSSLVGQDAAPLACGDLSARPSMKVTLHPPGWLRRDISRDKDPSFARMGAKCSIPNMSKASREVAPHEPICRSICAAELSFPSCALRRGRWQSLACGS
jgi:hypothetical protein